MDAAFVEKLKETHLAIWNERNREKRDLLLPTIYAEHVQMHDKEFTLHGNKEISEFIDKLQEDTLFDFKATSAMESIQNGARLYWHIQTAQGPLTGMDFFVVDNGKVTNIYAFIDLR